MRTCKACHASKDDLEFRPRVRRETGAEYFESFCRACHYARYKERLSDQQLEYHYGITRAQWELILKSQDYKCKICGEIFTTTIYVDHDHKTCVVRGLLCNSCNSKLSAVDNPAWLAKALNYVKHANALKELYDA